MSAPCRSCRAPIDWATGINGGGMPIDTASADDPGGNLAVWRAGATPMFRLIPGAGDAAPCTCPKPDCAIHGPEGHRGALKPGEHTALSHFAVCPDAASWRNRG